MFLEQINSPADLKRLSIPECEQLAAEIRTALLTKAAAAGGHLASNLGLVEATIALHYVFDSPQDKIVFDVSHQCYTHKMLTGRKDAFLCAEQYGAVSGYTDPAESEHDLFRVGHTATSVSLACGLAKARDLTGGSGNVIAVIGDGSLSGGEALEGLDFGGSDIEGNLIVLFNDNQMSIAEDHGGLYKNLARLRAAQGQAGDNLFKAFGYDYVFVGNGNSVADVVQALRQVKNIDHPVVVHLCTTKGKGYAFAEQHPEGTHYVRPFDLATGAEKNVFAGERYDRLVRDHLLEKMKQDPKVVTMIAAVPDSLSFGPEYRQAAGRQFIDVGIAEEHAIAMAAGLAKNGCKPVFATLATFYQRTYDQISQELCINSAPATLIVANASVYAPNDVTHIGIFDIPMMANIPNLVYLAPTNKQEYLAMLDWAIDQTAWPVALRAPRNGVFNAKGAVETDYSRLNTYLTVTAGQKIAILALGDFFQMGEELAAAVEAEYGFAPTLINPRYITGLDEALLEALKKDHTLVITLEDGVLDGGWGQKVASFYGPGPMQVLNYGLKKEFLDRYNVNGVLARNHLRPDLILQDIRGVF